MALTKIHSNWRDMVFRGLYVNPLICTLGCNKTNVRLYSSLVRIPPSLLPPLPPLWPSLPFPPPSFLPYLPFALSFPFLLPPFSPSGKVDPGGWSSRQGSRDSALPHGDPLQGLRGEVCHVDVIRVQQKDSY